MLLIKMAEQNKPELKTTRGHLKGQITKAIANMNKLMKSENNLDAVKLKLEDFDKLILKFYVVIP